MWGEEEPVLSPSSKPAGEEDVVAVQHDDVFGGLAPRALEVEQIKYSHKEECIWESNASAAAELEVQIVKFVPVARLNRMHVIIAGTVLPLGRDRAKWQRETGSFGTERGCGKCKQ